MEAEPLPARFLSNGNRTGGGQLVERVAAKAEVGAGAWDVEPRRGRLPGRFFTAEQFDHAPCKRLDQLGRNGEGKWLVHAAPPPMSHWLPQAIQPGRDARANSSSLLARG